ncbi:2-oxyglutarate/Fe(II) oxygenase [Nitzschia inconspicua]|uniref:2-oxyglutarate/Fe(II) oxygenase n=1 Tax=Nitzschia inconspicua TaxID=303405 RepID=A0A9K3LL49_9STRA|nr:2-oxyglutarate/Fe(II) oxygenase [Nitzschia inconspicua]
MMRMGFMCRVRFLSVSFLVVLCCLYTTSCAADSSNQTTTTTTTQVCGSTIDSNGQQETYCVQPSNSASELDQENRTSFCLPDGLCWDSLDVALVDKFHDPTKETYHVELINPVPFGSAQRVKEVDNAKNKTVQILGETYQYMMGLFKNDTAESFRDGCHCRNDNCALWAANGECENNPDYMLLYCAPVCQSCHHLSVEHRCPYDEDVPTVWGPGDLNKMFERITTDPFYVEKYQPNILSQPPEGPWVVTMENVVSQEECEKMIELATAQGFNPSNQTGEKNFDGTYGDVKNDERTSSNAWCMDECYSHPLHQNVVQRVENITDISDANSEYWQLLQYQVGQFYAEHHDYIPFHFERSHGVRIITVFLYLSDVEEGGGTHFNTLGITVPPKRGRVVIWPSVLDEDPNVMDPRTQHEALPVKKGIKYGANAWIHQRDYKEPFSRGCAA